MNKYLKLPFILPLLIAGLLIMVTIIYNVYNYYYPTLSCTMTIEPVSNNGYDIPE